MQLKLELVLELDLDLELELELQEQEQELELELELVLELDLFSLEQLVKELGLLEQELLALELLELELEQGLEPKLEGLQIELVQIYDFLIFCISMRHVILKVPKRSLPGHKPHVFGQRLEIESDHPGFLTSEQPCFTFH